jgi:hypothetical protein
MLLTAYSMGLNGLSSRSKCPISCFRASTELNYRWFLFLLKVGALWDNSKCLRHERIQKKLFKQLKAIPDVSILGVSVVKDNWISRRIVEGLGPPKVGDMHPRWGLGMFS